jgi:hypothetical protein
MKYVIQMHNGSFVETVYVKATGNAGIRYCREIVNAKCFEDKASAKRFINKYALIGVEIIEVKSS